MTRMYRPFQPYPKPVFKFNENWRKFQESQAGQSADKKPEGEPSNFVGWETGNKFRGRRREKQDKITVEKDNKQ